MSVTVDELRGLMLQVLDGKMSYHQFESALEERGGYEPLIQHMLLASSENDVCARAHAKESGPQGVSS